MKQVTGLRYIYKIESNRLAKNDWNIKIDDKDKRELIKTRQLIGLADSQGFRFIKELGKINDNEEESGFRKYIASIVFNSVEHFDYACKNGITINGDKFLRFVGTAGGIKKNTVLFVNKSIYKELKKKATNDMDKSVKMVRAKYEAYFSLMFSTSIPVSNPLKIAVVPDCITKFKEDTIYISEGNKTRKNSSPEPIVKEVKDMDIELNITDGFSLCTPELMEKWSKELLGDESDEVLSGVCLRNFGLKGMCYAWEIEEWIDTYNNGNGVIKDLWGNEVDLRECDLILTEGVLKVWKGYKSIDDYMKKCAKNGFTFAVCKTAESKIDKYRNLNYQYLQSFEMNDKDLRKLVMPTVERIKECICGDYTTTLKYLGVKQGMNKSNMDGFTFKEALSQNKALMNDEFIIKKINNMIKKEIDETKIGKIRVKGNYQVASGDPVCLLQNALGMEVTGLLKKGEFYSSFWDSQNVNEVLIMRSPMTCHNNIVKGKINHSDEARKWYRHMVNVMILNAWDNTMSAENGQDFDGDTNFTTNNYILLKNYKKKLTILCSQSSPEKELISEQGLAQSNKEGFDNNVGAVTNRATAMYDILATLKYGSQEYTTMMNRILSCQKLQQDVIDSAKGIIVSNMPSKWYSKSRCKTDLDLKLCCDKKPYFMMYIYKSIKREYNSWLKQWNDECYFDFGCSLDELRNKVSRTEEENKLLFDAYNDMPVTDNNCIMNRLCHMVEKEFDGFIEKKVDGSGGFDYTILKCKDINDDGDIDDYIVSLIREYNNTASEQIKNKTIDKDDNEREKISTIEFYKNEIRNSEIDRKQLLNRFIELAYTTNKGGRQLLWDVFAEDIIDNLIGGDNETKIYNE